MATLNYPTRWHATYDGQADISAPKSWFDGLARRWRAVKIAEQLRALSDRELDDIGVARRDIATLARRSAGL